jgi:hypothetical protein
VAEAILVSVIVFCTSGTVLALILCGSSRGAKRPVPTRANAAVDDPASVAG